MIEKIAQLEHLQWIEWSKNMKEFLLSIRNNSNKILIDAKITSWEKCWVDYSKLNEEEKEKDREWARKILKLLN
jgi:hypothetical protein